MGQAISASFIFTSLMLKKTGGPVLWRAADEGEVDKVGKLLRKQDLHVNWRDDEWENTALFRACLQGHTAAAEVLLGDTRTEENMPNRLGESPFFVACECGHLDLVKLMVENEAVDINQADMDGATPLWIAANEGHLDVIKILLASGRKVNVRAKTLGGPTSWSNKTAEERAKQVLHPEIAQLLRDYDKSPGDVVAALRSELGIAERCAAETFALLVLLSDEYLRLGGSQGKPDVAEARRKRFFRMSLALPMELQMVLCNLLHHQTKSYISVMKTEEALFMVAKVLDEEEQDCHQRKFRTWRRSFSHHAAAGPSRF